MRHGEPQGGSRYRGHDIDDPLSEKGWLQMRSAIADHASWDEIISSPLIRCRDFAEELSKKIDKPLSIEPQFKEVGFGVWEGKNKTQIIEENKQEFDAFYSDPVKNRPSGAEPLGDFISRVISAYEKVVQSHVDQHILIVAHAGVIRAIIAHVLHASPADLYRIKVDNASISRIRHSKHDAEVEFINGQLPD